MSNNWNGYQQAAEKGPWSITWKVILFVVAFSVVVGVIGYGFGWFGEAAVVAQQEFGPKAALEKYEWFIDQNARIKKMDQDIVMFEKRGSSVDEQYKSYGDDRSKWPPHIQVQFNRERQQAREDLIAVASQRNNLAREYNASSSKFNWAPFKTKPNPPKENFEEYVVK